MSYFTKCCSKLKSLYSEDSKFDREILWDYHNLEFDHDSRLNSINYLTDGIKNGEKVSLISKCIKYKGIDYQHWLINCGNYNIEFSPISPDTNYVVHINASINDSAKEATENKVEDADKDNGDEKMTDEMRERIGHVLGMKNFSLFLRNSEHVSNYIFRDKWVSYQMESGSLLALYQHHLAKKQIVLRVISFPSSIQCGPCSTNNILYSFRNMNDNFTANRLNYYVDGGDSSCNILLIGPSGAGKSHLINVLFNQQICKTTPSYGRVTEEVYFVRGRGRVYDRHQQDIIYKDLVVIDTVGICENQSTSGDIIKLIKQRSSKLHHLDAVYIVFRTGRIQPEWIEHIEDMLQKLNYNDETSKRFLFVGTNAECISDQQKNDLSEDAKKIFKIRTGTEVVYVGFPPEGSLDEQAKIQILKSCDNLKSILTQCNESELIQLPRLVKNPTCIEMP